jgi:NADPH2:quinone reductase
VRVNRLLLNNIAVVGVGWGAFALPRPGFAAEQWRELAPYLASGAIDPPVAGTYTLDDAAKALTDMDERRAAGKLVLTVR